MAQPTGTFTEETAAVDPALVAPTSYEPSLRELLAELAALMARHALPEPRHVSLNARGCDAFVTSFAEVDAWADALDVPIKRELIEQPDDPFFAYSANGELLGRYLCVNVYHHIPTIGELVEQPAVQS